MSSIIFKQIKTIKSSSIPPFQLFFLNKFSVRATKKIEPKIVSTGKYDVNPVKSFQYSYENIQDNLEQSGRLTYKYQPTSHYRKILLRKEYVDFKEKEKLEAEAKLDVKFEITEEKAKKIYQYLVQYNEEHPEKVKDEKKEFDLDEIMNVELKKKKIVPTLPGQPILEDEPSKEIKEEGEVFGDAVWGKEKPVERKYDRISSKELFWISRNEKYYKESDRKINYLKEFVGPYVIHDAEIVGIIKKIKEITPKKYLIETSQEFQIEKIYKENKEIGDLFQLLKIKIMKTHYKQLPNIALSLSFDLRYKTDVFKLWDYIDKEIFHNLHHFDLMDIAKIHYSMAGTMPKTGSLPLHKACIDLVKQEIKQATIYDVLYLYTSYKILSKDKLHSIFYQELLKRKPEVIALLKQDPDLIANLLYTYANSRIKKHNRKMIRTKDEHIEEAEKLIEAYYEDLLKGFDKISIESVSRLSTAFMILRVESYLDILSKIQNNVLQNLDKLDAFQVCSFLYSFSKFNNGRAEGDLKFYNQMTTLVEKFWQEFSNKDKARIFYAYTSRGFTEKNCGLIEKYFIPWANETVLLLSYSELANTVMSLMYIRYVQKDFWKNMIKNIAKQRYVVPMSHYFHLQMAKYYLTIFYPKWNYKTLEQALYEASNQFSAARVPKPTEDEEFLDFFRVLQFKFHINNKPYLEWDNLFTIDIAILPQKVGILKQAVIENFSDSYDIRPFYSLKKFILDNKGWKIWVVNWKEYLDQGANKDEWFMKHFNEVYVDKTIRFSQNLDKEQDKNIIDQYQDWYRYWAPKMGTIPPQRKREVNPVTGEVTVEFKEEQLDSRIFTTFGKQGGAKAPAAAAPGKTPAATGGAAAPKKPAAAPAK